MFDLPHLSLGDELVYPVPQEIWGRCVGAEHGGDRTSKRSTRRGRAVDADVIVVGGGLAGLVATAELADAGRRALLLDQEPEASLGGQAFWSLGGLFMVDTPEQRRMGIKDSHELAMQDWLGSASVTSPKARCTSCRC
jgi:uncharacterized protein